MARRLKHKVAAGSIAALAVAGAGGAVAATQLGSAKAESDAVVTDAAKQLGVEPSKLSAALKKALEDRVDAAVAAGRLTKADADALKARIESGDVPIFGAPHARPFVGVHMFGPLAAATTYLGISDTTLRAELDSGKTLAQVAKDRGKSVVGLVQALVADAKKHLDDAVADGRLTKDQEQRIAADLQSRVTDFVNGKPGTFGPGLRPGRELHDRFGQGFRPVGVVPRADAGI
jgi:hypothetical protein